jgi:hypothetical protein
MSPLSRKGRGRAGLREPSVDGLKSPCGVDRGGLNATAETVQLAADIYW